MRTFVTLFAAAALMAAPTVATAANGALAPATAGRAGAELADSNGMGGKAWLATLAVASMGILAVLISRPASP
ncbi:MAG: hypothetical protein ACAH11_02010 [Sphingomonas sp.]|nr:hypothetical protein [Sphingomonas sp.]